MSWVVIKWTISLVTDKLFCLLCVTEWVTPVHTVARRKVGHCNIVLHHALQICKYKCIEHCTNRSCFRSWLPTCYSHVFTQKGNRTPWDSLHLFCDHKSPYRHRHRPEGTDWDARLQWMSQLPLECLQLFPQFPPLQHQSLDLLMQMPRDVHHGWS